MKGRYAFVEFKSAKDADAAIAATNGTSFHNYKLVVELPKPKDARGGRRAGPDQNDQCWKCGKLGHWASDCRMPGGRDDNRRGGRRSPSRDRSPRRYGGGGRDDRGRGRDRSDSRGRDDGRSKELREGLCFICKERGHLKRDCPDLGGGRRGPPSRGYDRPQRRYSRSRSPPPMRDDRRRRDYSPRRSPPRRSPPRRRDYSRSRSP